MASMQPPVRTVVISPSSSSPDPSSHRSHSSSTGHHKKNRVEFAVIFILHHFATRPSVSISSTYTSQNLANSPLFNMLLTMIGTGSVDRIRQQRCLLLLYACDGMQITKTEALGNPWDGLHPIQDRLAQYNGSQCGFRSPAQVMNMYGHAPKTGVLKNGVYATTCENCGHFFKFRATGPLRSSVSFTINGKPYTVGNEYPGVLSLSEFMRSQGISYGTKTMCIEGGCGVCLVTTTLYDPISKATQTYAINSCLLLLYACDGMQITTIEGLGNPWDGLHPIQDRLAQYNGSQCGFCSPAQVMNMYGLLRRVTNPTMQQVEDTFDTSICRCTGYRPILDAMKSFASDAPARLPGGPIDIEELDKKICSKTGQACKGRCSTKNGHLDNVPLHMVLQGAQWYKPTTKQELYSLLGRHKGDSYRLVFGNSGFGIYREIGPWMYDILIDLRGIGEFYDVTVEPNSSVVLGSNISLNSLIEIFQKYRDLTVTTLLVICPTLLLRLSEIWAGNLMLKNLHTEFPSDVFTMFEGIGAKVLIGSGDGSETLHTLMDFLSLDMKGKVIVNAVLPVFTTDDVYFKTCRVSQRHQNSHAYVNTAFLMQLDRNNNFLVKSKPSIVYGGISKTLVHATNTETYLVGKQLGDPSVLKGAIDSLANEVVPDETPDLSSIAFRKNLALTLFYKFVLSVCGEKAAPTYRSGGTDLIRPLSSGTQTYGTHKDEWPLTEPMAKKSATLQTSGQVQFINDIPPLPSELYASFVISTVGNAEIDSVDPSDALAYPGVLRYISATDIPAGGVNSFRSPDKPVEEIFSSGKILYNGQPIGLIVAVDKLTADTGASMVKVSYKNIQPPITTIEDALKKGSIFPGVAQEFKIGDAAGAIARSDQKITGNVSLGNQYHFHLETQISISYPTEDGVGMKLVSATQWADNMQFVLALVLNAPLNCISIETRRIGGSFGARIFRAHLPACASAVAARVMRRPVRLAMNFHTNMKAIGSRYPYLVQYQVGVTNEGKLNGIILTVNANCGCSPNDRSLTGITRSLDNAYFCPNWDYKPVAVKTNLPANTAARAPGSVESIFMVETVMEHVAKFLNKDPLEVRKLNLYNKGQTTISGMVLEYCDIKDMVSQIETMAGVQARKQQIAAFNTANRWKKKGLSVQPLRFSLDFRNSPFNVYMTVYHWDGSVAISLGGVDFGQGIHTKVMQVCAYELGIPIDSIQIKPTTTLANSNSIISGGSVTSETNALGVINCCKQLKERMAPVKAKMKNPTWKELVAKCFEEGMDLSTKSFLYEKDIIGNYNSYGVTCTEVELDVLTGENQITRVDILYDCGESMNPEIDIGQVEGAFVMGLGYWMTEQLIFDPKTGANLTNGTWGYQPPLGKDIPIDFRINSMKNHPNQRGVLRSKAVGEPPICMSASALFAIKHAIESARKDAAKDTFFPLNGPATVEEIQTACQIDPTQLVYGT